MAKVKDLPAINKSVPQNPQPVFFLRTYVLLYKSYVFLVKTYETSYWFHKYSYVSKKVLFAFIYIYRLAFQQQKISLKYLECQPGMLPIFVS